MLREYQEYAQVTSMYIHSVHIDSTDTVYVSVFSDVSSELYISFVNIFQVVECDDEKLIDIDFGDSEEEEEEEKEEENGQRLTATTSRSGGLTASVTVSQGVGGGTRGTAAGRRGGGGEGGREEDSDDDGFCILDAPTSTYVVMTHVHIT